MESHKRLVDNIKKSKKWHHDIKLVDGRWIEDVVVDFQKADHDGREELIEKIIDNYGIFRTTWAKTFAPFIGNDIEAGKVMHDQIVWKSATKFDMQKSQKDKGEAFNAYVVSALLNQWKNLKYSKQSAKHAPRVKCPICNEEVFHIDHKHLQHRVDLERYRKMFPKYPLVSTDGRTMCPVTGEWVEEITEARVNRVLKTGAYSVEDFWAEHPGLAPRYPARCPATGILLEKPVTAAYPGMLSDGYTEQQFSEDFPDFEGLVRCPFTGKKLLEVTQEHLDFALKQRYDASKRVSIRKFQKMYPNVTLKTRPAKVVNPFTNKQEASVTPEELARNGTTVQGYLEEHATLWLDQYYPALVVCPLTGRRTHMIRRTQLDKMNRSVFDFYKATCAYPMTRHLVKSGLTGEWVENVWTHLEQSPQTYAQPVTPELFEQWYGTSYFKATVSTNSYVESDSGDSVHVGDLLAKGKTIVDMLEVEDSLLSVADDELDKRIAKAVRHSRTVEDIISATCQEREVPIPEPYTCDMSRTLRATLRKRLGESDFDLLGSPSEGQRSFAVRVPSKSTIKTRLSRMVSESDLLD